MEERKRNYTAFPEKDHLPEKMTDRKLVFELRHCGGTYETEPMCETICDIKCGYYREWIRRGKPKWEEKKKKNGNAKAMPKVRKKKIRVCK